MKNVSSRNMGQYHTKNLKSCLRKLCFSNCYYPLNILMVLFKRATQNLSQLNFKRCFDIVPKQKFLKKISNCGKYRKGIFLGGW